MENSKYLQERAFHLRWSTLLLYYSYTAAVMGGIAGQGRAGLGFCMSSNASVFALRVSSQQLREVCSDSFPCVG